MWNVRAGTGTANRVRFGDLEMVSEVARKKAEMFLSSLPPEISDRNLHIRLTNHIGPTFLPIRELEKYHALQTIAQSNNDYSDTIVELARRCMKRLNNFYAPLGENLGFTDN